jgi:CheY-like chemotaxis protein
MSVEAWDLPVTLLTAADGFEGLLRAGEFHPDMMITDLNMPGIDGFRMIRKLRAAPEFRQMRMVVVTALGKNEIADRGGLPEDVLILTKPVPFSQLEQIVRDALPAARQPRAA